MSFIHKIYLHRIIYALFSCVFVICLWRRSIYRFIVRTTPHQFLSTLDCPDPANLTPARVRTTTALQALALANNDFMLRQARRLAERAEREAGGGEAGVRRAIELAFQREATAGEVRAGAGLAAPSAFANRAASARPRRQPRTRSAAAVPWRRSTDAAAC